MSIEDRLTAGGAAWRESQPPVTVSPVPEVRRKPVLWLPLTAAAATVAVVLGASLLVSRDDSPAPFASDVVPYADLRPTEADVPSPGRFASFPESKSPFIPPCESGDAVGTFTVVAQGQGRLALRTTGASGCLLARQDGLRVSTVTSDGRAHSAEASEPRLWDGDDNSPRRALGQEPLLVDVDFPGQCLAQRAGLAVEGVVPGVLRVAVESVCGGDPIDGGRFDVGPLHVAGEPHARVPDDREALEISLELSGSARFTGPLDYVVRLANPTARPISLEPCPAYSTGFYRKDSTGESYSQRDGRLNCAAAPDAVPAGGSIAFAMVQETTDPDGVAGPDDAEAMVLLWRIAGPTGGTAAVPFPGSLPSSTTPPVQDAGTTTALRADLDDDGRPDLATVSSTTGLVVVTTATGSLPALRLAPSVTLEVQGVLDLPGRDGLLVSTTSAGAREAAQTAVVIRVVGDRLEQLRYGDGEREPVRLEFNNGRGDQWAGVRCTATGLLLAKATLRSGGVGFSEQELTLGPAGLGRGEVRVKDVLVDSSSDAVATAAQMAATRCAGLSPRGLASGERSVTYAR